MAVLVAMGQYTATGKVITLTAVEGKEKLVREQTK